MPVKKNQPFHNDELTFHTSSQPHQEKYSENATYHTDSCFVQSHTQVSRTTKISCLGFPTNHLYASSFSFPGLLPLSWSNTASFRKIYFLSRLEIDPQLIPSCFITADHPCVLLVSDKHLCHSLLTSFRNVMLLLRNFCLETFNSNVSKPHFAANIHFTCWPLHPLSG